MCVTWQSFYFLLSMQALLLKANSHKVIEAYPNCPLVCVIIHIFVFIASDGLCWMIEASGEKAAPLKADRLYEHGVEL